MPIDWKSAMMRVGRLVVQWYAVWMCTAVGMALAMEVLERAAARQPGGCGRRHCCGRKLPRPQQFAKPRRRGFAQRPQPSSLFFKKNNAQRVGSADGAPVAAACPDCGGAVEVTRVASRGGNRTRHGADTQQVLASVVRTARQRGLDLPPLIAVLLRAPEPAVPETLGLPPPTA